jgi:hypothetical protein
MSFEEIWRKKIDAMKARERTTTTKGSLEQTRRKGREKGRREKGRREKGRSVPASRGIIDDVYDARKVRGSTYTFRPPSPSPVESFSIV